MFARVQLTNRSTAVWAAAAALLLSACGSSADLDAASAAKGSDSAGDAAVSTFVGAVEGTDAFVAIQANGAETLVYVCDGQKIWSYLDGQLENGELTAIGPGGLHLEARVTPGEATGSITLENESVHAFQAVAAAGEAGLFALAGEQDGQLSLGSWIRLADGQIRGKTVSVAVDGAAPAVGVDDGGGAVPPAANPEPAAKRQSLLRCALAAIRTSKAIKAFNDDPSDANSAALDAARAESGIACVGVAATPTK